MSIEKSEPDGSDMNVKSAGMNTDGTSVRPKLPPFKFPQIHVYPRSQPWAGVLVHWEELEYDWQGNPKLRKGHASIPVNGRRVPPRRVADDEEFGEDYWG